MTKHKNKNRKTGNVPHLSEFKAVARSENINKKFILTTTGTCATDGFGNLTKVLNLDPSAANDWNLVNNYYDEFRIVGVRLLLLSSQQFSVTKTNAVGYIIFDNDSVTTIAFTVASQYVNKKVIPAIFTHTNGKLLVYQHERPATKSSPIPWSDVATPSGSPGSVQIVFANGALSVSTEYYQYQLEFMVEARGRR